MIAITTMIKRNTPPATAPIITTGLPSSFACLARIFVVAPWKSSVGVASDSVVVVKLVNACVVVGGSVVVGTAETIEHQIKEKIRVEIQYKTMDSP